MKTFIIKAKVWVYPGMGAWRFVNTGPKETKMLQKLPRAKKAGFGSIRVRCTTGQTTWDTSVFPSKEGPYLLPLKSAVRRREMIADDDTVTITCHLLRA